jgi:hypothetical protein
MKTQYDYWKEAHDQVMAEMAALPMNYKLEDTRPNNYFKYGIKVIGMLDFHAVRNWFSQTYGPCESLAHGSKIDNLHWSFEIIYQNYTIYVKDDEELSWFKIKYGEPS